MAKILSYVICMQAHFCYEKKKIMLYDIKIPNYDTISYNYD